MTIEKTNQGISLTTALATKHLGGSAQTQPVDGTVAFLNSVNAEDKNIKARLKPSIKTSGALQFLLARLK